MFPIYITPYMATLRRRNIGANKQRRGNPGAPYNYLCNHYEKLIVTYHGWVQFNVPISSFDNNDEKYSLKTLCFCQQGWQCLFIPQYDLSPYDASLWRCI